MRIFLIGHGLRQSALSPSNHGCNLQRLYQPSGTFICDPDHIVAIFRGVVCSSAHIRMSFDSLMHIPDFVRIAPACAYVDNRLCVSANRRWRARHHILPQSGRHPSGVCLGNAQPREAVRPGSVALTRSAAQIPEGTNNENRKVIGMKTSCAIRCDRTQGGRHISPSGSATGRSSHPIHQPDVE